MAKTRVAVALCMLGVVACKSDEPAPPEEPARIDTVFPVTAPAFDFQLPVAEATANPLEDTSIRFEGSAGQRLALLGAHLAGDANESTLLLRLVNCDARVVCPTISLEVDAEQVPTEMHFDRQLSRAEAVADCIAPGHELYAVATLAGARTTLDALVIHAEGTSQELSDFANAPLAELDTISVSGGRADIEATASNALSVSIVRHGARGEPLWLRTVRTTSQTFSLTDPGLVGAVAEDLTVLFEPLP